MRRKESEGRQVHLTVGGVMVKTALQRWAAYTESPESAAEKGESRELYMIVCAVQFSPHHQWACPCLVSIPQDGKVGIAARHQEAGRCLSFHGSLFFHCLLVSVVQLCHGFYSLNGSKDFFSEAKININLKEPERQPLASQNIQGDVLPERTWGLPESETVALLTCVALYPLTDFCSKEIPNKQLTRPTSR